MADRNPMSFEFTPQEEAVIRELSEQLQLSPNAVMRQALRHYQLLQHRLRAGETFQFSGDANRAMEFAGILAWNSNTEPTK